MALSAMWRFAILALSLAVFWRIVHVNAVLYESDGRPRLPGLAAAAGGPSEREILRGVLQENPAEVAALLMLARDFGRASLEEATRAYRLASRLAPLDREVLAGAAEFLLRHDNVREGLGLLARLAEHYPDARDRAFPVMAEILASRRHSDAWNEFAAGDPEWLRLFILASCQRGMEPGFLVPLALKRIASGKPAAAESACLIERLRLAGRWDEAYQMWLNTLSRERLANVGYVFNGSFEFPASGIGFDWMPATGAQRATGHAVDLAQTHGAAGKRALRVAYNGKRQLGNAIAQFLAVPPGRYELSGLARPDSLQAGRGVHWALRCVEQGKAGAPIAHSERFVGSSEWRRFAFEVTIAPDCGGQILQLEPAGEGTVFIDGTVWFDDLVLRRRLEDLTRMRLPHTMQRAPAAHKGDRP